MIHSQALCFQYPGGVPIAFPDISVPQGGVLLLSGPSGCGKSTWLSLVAALVAPTAGELVVADQPLGALKSAAADAWRARTGGRVFAATNQEHHRIAYLRDQLGLGAHFDEIV